MQLDMHTATLEQRAAQLLEILQLEQVEQNLYLGKNEARAPMRLFGGQVLAQAAMAASQTVEEVALHSAHAYFLRAGSAERDVLYEVERIRDGRSFTTRRVVAIQNGEAIFNMDASFQVIEPGFEHATPMPNVPMPEELEDDVSVARGLGEDPRLSPMAKIARPFETRSVFRIGSDAWAAERYHNPLWIRFPLADQVGSPALGRVLLAYASDMGMVSTASLPHQPDTDRKHLQMASLDHALWIHRPVPADEWILFHKHTTIAQGSRGMVHADFFSRQGNLIASVTQEGLLRPVS